MVSQKKYTPGTPVPDSGTVKVPGKPGEVTVVKNEPFPPPPAKGDKWVYTRKTPHKK